MRTLERIVSLEVSLGCFQKGPFEVPSGGGGRKFLLTFESLASLVLHQLWSDLGTADLIRETSVSVLPGNAVSTRIVLKSYLSDNPTQGQNIEVYVRVKPTKPLRIHKDHYSRQKLAKTSEGK